MNNELRVIDSKRILQQYFCTKEIATMHREAINSVLPSVIDKLKL